MTRARLLLVLWCMSAASVAHANNAPAAANDTAAPAAPTPFTLPDSAAQAAIKKLPKEVVNARRAKRFSLAEQAAQEESAERGIDEIVVYGSGDPEDFVSKRPPMLAFRDRLDRTPAPMSPAQMTQATLCLIGLCGKGYGPEGIPIEGTASTRAEKNKDRSALQQTLQFRGTFQ